MIAFQCFVFFFHSLFLDIFSNDLLGSMLTDRVHGVTLSPKLPTPELPFHFGTSLENFPGYDALYHCDNLRYAVRRNALNKKMNMILVRTNFQEPNLVSFFDLPARLR